MDTRTIQTLSCVLNHERSDELERLRKEVHELRNYKITREERMKDIKEFIDILRNVCYLVDSVTIYNNNEGWENIKKYYGESFFDKCVNFYKKNKNILELSSIILNENDNSLVDYIEKNRISTIFNSIQKLLDIKCENCFQYYLYNSFIILPESHTTTLSDNIHFIFKYTFIESEIDNLMYEYYILGDNDSELTTLLSKPMKEKKKILMIYEKDDLLKKIKIFKKQQSEYDIYKHDNCTTLKPIFIIIYNNKRVDGDLDDVVDYYDYICNELTKYN